MSAQDLINNYGRKKWPEHGPEAAYFFQEEDRHDGYCDTCYSEWEVQAVYVVPDPARPMERILLEEFSYTSVTEMLDIILKGQ